MQQINYVFDAEAATKELAAAMRISSLARKLAQWRRLALFSFGLFMASVIGNLIQLFGR